MPQEIIQVDAFTPEPFKGNPAAICVMDAAPDEAWMQTLATEMNLSETAYLLKQDDGYSLRWFTPATEVDLCGHATVAAAHVLWEEGLVEESEACRFQTRSGLLVARKDGEWIEVDFPREDVEPIEIRREVLDALGVEAVAMVQNRLSYCLVEVEDEAVVRGASPDMSALKALAFHGFILTSPSKTSDSHVISRFFAPSMGIDEDPVTGSAHCVLGTYWAPKLGRDEFLAYQASARGGYVRVKLLEDSVRLGGQAVTVMRGTLL